jgi:hypothetical protein
VPNDSSPDSAISTRLCSAAARLVSIRLDLYFVLRTRGVGAAYAMAAARHSCGVLHETWLSWALMKMFLRSRVVSLVILLLFFYLSESDVQDEEKKTLTAAWAWS